MFIHLVLVTYKGNTSAAFHQKIHTYCDRINATLPGVRSYDYCANLVDLPGAHTHAIVATYDSVDAYRGYYKSTLHDELKFFMMDQVRSHLIFDFDTTLRTIGEPFDAAKITELVTGLSSLRGKVY